MNLSTAIPLRLRRPVIAGLALVLALAPAARAFVFALGDVKGTFDTTLSIGGLVRLDNPDPALYGLTNTYNGVPGLQRSVNADDGDLNYHRGLASFLVKASHELELDYQNSGLFIRGYYFNDFVNSNGTREKAPLTDAANALVSDNAVLLDAYVYTKEKFGDTSVSFRLGRQVLSWGESTFIPNGINSINPIDVAKLRTPGSELKEALLPVDMASMSIKFTDNLSLEAFYQLDWQKTRIDPPGSYFSTNDFVGPGGNKVYLGFGAIPDTSTLGAIPRGNDVTPGNAGQYGLNLHWLAHGLNDTEFGLYYMNYHSRLPLISATTPTTPLNTGLIVSNSATALQNNAAFLGGLVPAATAAGVPTATALSVLIGASLGDPTATATLNALTPLQALLPTVAGVTGAYSQQELLTEAATGRYIIEYPKDIHLVGASFNTSVGGIALQGEVSYRENQPLQIDDVELLFAALSPLSSKFGANNQLGTYALSTYIPGYRSIKVWTGQMTATWTGRGILGAAQSTVVAEAGFVNADLPDKSVLRFDGPGTFVGGNLNYMNLSGSNASGVPPPSEPASAFADSFSWGYQLVGKLDYNNVFRGVNVSPLIVFAHDVGGNTPLPMGNFVHGRKTITLGTDFSFQNAWALELRYVNFFGAGRYNLLSDRDYVSCNLKYSF
jgi:hypothetical protein